MGKNHIKLFTEFINEGYYDDIDGYVSTSKNKSGYKEDDLVKNSQGQEGIVYDVLVAPNEMDYVVVVKFGPEEKKSIGKYGTETGKFTDIKQLSKA